MRAAEGQKWSYVEMILNSEVEEKLRCDEEWKKRMKHSPAGMVQGRYWGKGRPRPPKRPQAPPKRIKG